MGTKKRIGDYQIEIIRDDDPLDPRENDNLGTMVCFHGRYDLGDEHDYKHDDYSGWEEMKFWIIKNENVAVILPLYLYDHSGITMKTSPFDCQWDSGQIGFIIISKEKVREEFSVKRINKKLIERVEKILEAEVSEYDDFIQGDCFGYNIYRVTKDEDDKEDMDMVSSVFGYYGEENCMKDAEGEVELMIKNELSEELVK